ncbi:Scr1 family TA system antitoxin-like transcriptional regulator [Streptomyces sp. TE33382]
MSGARPGPGRIVSGLFLRHLRRTAQLTLGAVASRSGMAPTTVSRIERGLVRARWGQVVLLCELYGVPAGGGEEFAGAWTLGVSAGTAVRDSGALWEGRLAAVEHSTCLTLSYCRDLLPSELRTPRYAQAVQPGTAPPGFTRPDVLGRTRPVVVLDAGVLTRPVGGPEVFAEQLAALAGAVHGRRIDLRVLTSGDSRLAGEPGPGLAERRIPNTSSLLYAEEDRDGVTYTCGRTTDVGHGGFPSALVARAASGAESLALLERAALAASDAVRTRYVPLLRPTDTAVNGI